MFFSILPPKTTNAATTIYNIKITKTYKIQKGEKLKLYVKGHKNSKKVKWKSSKKKVASVSKRGVVTGRKGGTTKITATIGKKKYTIKVIVIVGERTVYEKDINPEPPEDGYDVDVPTPENDNVTYNEWMSQSQLEKCGLSFLKLPATNIIHINGQTAKDSLSGTCASYNLSNVPSSPEINVIYGSELRYKWNGSEFLYNTNDLMALGLIIR